MSSLRTPNRCQLARGLIIVVALIPAIPAHAAGTNFPSPTGGGPTPLLFLHPLVNYREDPQWIRQWERGLQRGSTLRANVGSVSTDDFSTAVELHVTEPISTRFRALYDLQWRDVLHMETAEQQHFLGLEFALFSSLALQLQAHPASRKEEMDVRTGVLWHDAGREQYLRILVRWDDFLFEDEGAEIHEVVYILEHVSDNCLALFPVFFLIFGIRRVVADEHIDIVQGHLQVIQQRVDRSPSEPLNFLLR